MIIIDEQFAAGEKEDFALPALTYKCPTTAAPYTYKYHYKLPSGPF